MAGIAEVSQEFLERLLEGDPRCKHSIGSSVMKMDSDLGDLHTPGVQGKVLGSIFNEETGLDCYLVQFGNDPAPTFLIGKKIIGL